MSSTVVGLFLLVAVAAPIKSAALSGSDFNVARIIDDTVFFNPSTMNEGDIQNFLNAKVPSCDVWGTGPSGRSGYATRADWGRANGNPPPYTCLRDYSQQASGIAANSYCGALNGGTRSAANTIFDVSRACNLNPQTILVLLQKEQSLITDDWPWPIQYRSATGYGCPDTAPCDAEYYGFFNQVYNAAKQFRRYTMQPNSFNYASGRTSFISYQANNPGCSGTNVTIQNGATAALYNYTPYQPNAAALANLYGTGDGCSAYGNRNFWRMFNDWFGPTLGDLVRTPDDATVYLISGIYKYPIADGSVLNDFGGLGPIRFVTNEYIGNKTTGPVLGHMVGAPDGTLYFVNAGIKLPFTSCDMVAQYGYSCSQVIQLSDGQLSRLYTGPNITAYYNTTSGKRFYISGGQKREVFDTTSLTQASLGGNANTLLEAGLSYLPYGQPVIRNGVIATSRASGTEFYYDTSQYMAIGSDFKNSSSFASLPHSSLDDASIPSGQRATGFKGFIKNNASSQYYVITDTGKAALTNPSSWTGSFTTMSDSFLSSSPTNSTGQINNGVVKSTDDGTVYYVTGAKKRPIASWNDLVTLSGGSVTITTLKNATINGITNGPLYSAPGTLIKSVSNATVYIVSGDTQLYPISSFTFPQEMGLALSVRTISDADVQTYSVQNTTLRNKLLCNSKYYVANKGEMWEVPSGLMAEYGFQSGDFQDVGASLCSALKKYSTLTRYIRTSDGTIYYITGGKKRAFTSYQTYTSSGGSAANTALVSDFFATMISSGPNM
mgnify:FL=1